MRKPIIICERKISQRGRGHVVGLTRQVLDALGAKARDTLSFIVKDQSKKEVTLRKVKV